MSLHLRLHHGPRRLKLQANDALSVLVSVSAAISILLIAIGFAAADWRFEWLKKGISMMFNRTTGRLLNRKTSKSDSDLGSGMV